MNTTNLKKYAPQARRDFMAAVSHRLNQFGIHADSKGKLSVSTPVVSGSVMQIEGLSLDAGLARAREKLVRRAEKMGFEQLVEQMAYTWFNRLSAIRFMELHGYLDHNLRVLSPSPSKGEGRGEGFQPEILAHAQDVATDLGLDRNHIVELKLAGNKDEELYRTLLLGQCHQLHQAMPFLFEALDDETELLLPDNLTRTDSILRGLVDSIPEDDWQQVEIIGWLYQFYISEKKDQVIGSVVKSEDIPAATQLFTPNWIVKYLVQNSVGRQWLMTYPDSGLKAQMEYYIEPAEQEPSVVEALAAITPNSIDPETIKVLDPACGSGHILVEAYDILKAIYEERGYRVRDIPKLILEKNLYGLDIDDRAAQLAGFALLMKARADDRRIFSRDIKLNVLAIQTTQNLDLPDLWHKLALNQDTKRGSMESIFDDVQSNLAYTVDDIEFKQLRAILALFEQAKTLGSLIQVPHEQAEYLRKLTCQLRELTEQGDSMQKQAAMALLPYVHQACLLAGKYDAVVANPPYMGNKSLCNDLKIFLSKYYIGFERDLFSAFICRNVELTKASGFSGIMTSFVWMYISTYECVRDLVANKSFISSLVQLDYDAFEHAKAHICAFISQKIRAHDYKGVYINLEGFKGAHMQAPKFLEAINKNCSWRFVSCFSDFENIPGSPITFWVDKALLKAFKEYPAFSKFNVSVKGLDTCDNATFVRRWFEVSISEIGFNINNTEETKNSARWFPYAKGGFYRKWYGNNEFIVDWKNDGEILRNLKDDSGKVKARPQSTQKYFLDGINFSAITSSDFSCRFMTQSIFGGGGNAVFSEHPLLTLGFLNSKLVGVMTKALNPTLNILVGDILRLPYKNSLSRREEIQFIVRNLIELSKEDWGKIESSWEFSNIAWVTGACKRETVKKSWERWLEQCDNDLKMAQRLETENNSLFIAEYKLEEILHPEVDAEKIPFIRGNKTNDTVSLISYAIGCMMGRYSLDEPGLIYAHAGNVDFDPSRYPSFPADEDGILPLTDQEWFKDDASNRFREFLLAVWGENTLQQNLEFVAESLTLSSFKLKKGETSLDTVRRYLSNQFYKDHLQTYKKRPIYWLFSSGKQKAFECLVYLHRYNDSTLARMRTEYVTPLLGKYSAFADQLNQQLQDASSSEATRIKKDIQALEKKQTELRQFDDKLKHYADMRIKLDLDDGVKVNYGKFGDLLAEVKAVTGGAGD